MVMKYNYLISYVHKEIYGLCVCVDSTQHSSLGGLGAGGGHRWPLVSTTQVARAAAPWMLVRPEHGGVNKPK